MKDKIKFYLAKGQVVVDKNIVPLAQKYLEKSKRNLLTMQAIYKIGDSQELKKMLKLPKDYDPNEWVVIAGYYAMYSASLALLAKIGFRSKNHTATLIILEEYFVKKKHLNETDLSLIRNAQFQKEEVEKLSDARHKREIAQYSITKETTKNIAEKIKKDAYDFINKVELILMQK
ncbi:MAG: HEPN domain-containing protein [Nanoarchaeota archaeon]